MLVSVLILLFAVLSALLLLKLARLRRDLLLLGNAVRELYREGGRPSGRFRSEEVQSLWSTLLLFLRKSRELEPVEKKYDRLLSLTGRLAAESHDMDAAARELVQAVSEETAGEAQAVAVVVEDAKKRIRVAHSLGIPQRRIEQAVLICFERARDQDGPETENRGWGYRTADHGSCFDFGVFGIELSLLVPLRNDKGICGAIWLGLKKGTSLRPERRQLLRAIAEHAASSFQAAQVADARSESNRKERDFLLGLSHDVRAPGIRALYALRELSAENEGFTSRQLGKLQLVERSITEQLEVLGDVLEYAKHQQGLLTGERSALSLHHALHHVFDRFLEAAKMKSLTFTWSPIPTVRVFAVPAHFKRVVSNVLSNALKYTDGGGIDISFRLTERYAEVLISDTGVGVPPEDRPSLFCEFKRGSNGAERDGIGLGLALCKSLVEANEGYVFYRPNHPAGSTFGIGFQLALGGEDLCPIARRLETAVVVDDDASVCRAHVRQLRAFADRITPAGSVHELQGLLATGKPDLVMCDVHLSGNTFQELLDVVPEDVPLLVVTGDCAWLPPAEAGAKRKIEVLEKPLLAEALERGMSRLLTGGPNRLRAGNHLGPAQ